MKKLLLISHGKDGQTLQRQIQTVIQRNLDSDVTLVKPSDEWADKTNVLPEEFLNSVRRMDRVAFVCTSSMKDTLQRGNNLTLLHGRKEIKLEYQGVHSLLNDSQLCSKCILLCQDFNNIYKGMHEIKSQVQLNDGYIKELRQLIAQ